MNKPASDSPRARRSWFPILLILSALLCAGLALYQYLTYAPPQAQPLIQLLAAVADQDPERLAACFSQRVIQRFEKRYVQKDGQSREAMWRDLLSIYTEVLDDDQEAQRAEALRYSFNGGPDHGYVEMRVGERKYGRMAVVYEGGSWRLDER